MGDSSANGCRCLLGAILYGAATQTHRALQRTDRRLVFVWIGFCETDQNEKDDQFGVVSRWAEIPTLDFAG